MSNYADCQLVSDKLGGHAIVAVTSARTDGRKGSYYTLHSPGGELISAGFSGGVEGSGLGSALMAMQNGKRAAKRWLASCSRQQSGDGKFQAASGRSEVPK